MEKDAQGHAETIVGRKSGKVEIREIRLRVH